MVNASDWPNCEAAAIKWLKQGAPGGQHCLTLLWPDDYWPQTVKTDKPFERSWITTLPVPEFALDRIWTFIGLDQMDCAEVDLEIYAHDEKRGDLYPVVLRSFHRHGGPQDFESWVPYEVYTGEQREFRVFTRARKMRNCGQIRAHFGIKFVGW